jgi:hypothetical protein
VTLNVSKCLADAVAAGKLSQAQARDAEARVTALVQKGLPEADAVTRAAQEIGADAARKQRQTALRIIAARRAVAQAEAHPGGFWQGVMAMLARDIRVRAGYSNVEGRAQAIVAEAHARLAHLLDAYRTTALGFRQDLPGLRRFVRALYGDAGDTAASGFARAWTETTDRLVDRFNAAGGDLANRATWRLPQMWNRDAVKRAGQGEFTAFMNAEMERGGLRILDPDTGQPVAADRAAEIIAKAYQRIESNGLVDLVPGQPGGTALANSRSQARAFEWTDADAWFRFNDRFGEGDGGIYDMLVGHIDGIARDIGMLEILGPNPAQMVRFLGDTAKQRGASATQVRMLENLWGTVNGQQASPVNEWLANTMAGVRSWLTSVQLGSAVLTSVTDFATIRQTAAWNGLPAAQVMQRYLTLLNPANAEDRVTAVRLGLIADGWTTRALGAMRHQADIVGRDLAGRVADVVMRASGMSAHTQAAKWAFGMEFSGHLADRAGRALDQLEPELRRSFARYGISAEDWDIIRARGVWEQDGVRFILPEQIVQGAPGSTAPADQAAFNRAASRLLEMINGETRFAVVEPGALERSVMLGGSQPGTAGGEFRRATAQYKSFPVAMMTRHLGRAYESLRGGDHGAYLATLAVGLTAMGALAMQLREVANGRDPRDMADARFWGAAFMQGGGAGILGDFLYAGLTRADRGFYMTAIGGPTAGLVDDVVRLTGGNIQGLAEDKDTHFGRELARFAQRNTPGTSLWYSRLAVDRLMWERLQEMLDPQAPRRWREIERRRMQDYDQEFWWSPGSTAPARAPSILGSRD